MKLTVGLRNVGKGRNGGSNRDALHVRGVK
jgi:hypothetical protein